MTGSQALGSPVHRAVATELERLAERWRQLPLDRALLYSGRVRGQVQTLADRVAEASGVAASVVPDLGPATLMDQLSVMVYDASAVAVIPPATPPAALTRTTASPTPATSTVASSLVADLEALRRELA